VAGKLGSPNGVQGVAGSNPAVPMVYIFILQSINGYARRKMCRAFLLGWHQGGTARENIRIPVGLMMEVHKMKVYPRTSEMLGAVNLFDSLALAHGLDLTKPDDAARFGSVAAQAMAEVRAQPTVLHGWRVQAMFAYVAASLGEVDVVKEEDAGRLVARSATLQVPDYRVVLRSGEEFFVEVKNCHKASPSARLSLTGAYCEGLAEYARQFGRPVRVAIYWSRWNTWTLVPLTAMSDVSGKRGISFIEAYVANEMTRLGDELIGTKAPLVLSFVADVTKPRAIQADGQVPFTVGAVEMYCDGQRIAEDTERNIAFYLMCYGRWEMKKSPRVDGNALVSLDFVFSPVEDSGQGFEMVGAISGMISQQYNELTTTVSRSIRRLTPRSGPGALGLIVEEGYQGIDLPLWRFKMEVA
jgi:hypothetical protein